MILFIIFIHAFVLWTLDFFLYPELLIYPYLTASGFLPYKNILDQHFPGLMFFPINFYTLGFNNPGSFRLLLISIVVVQSLLIYKVALKIGNKQIATLASLAYLIWQPFFEGNQLWLDIFLPLFTLPAFLFFLNEQWFFTGLFLGLGIVFKQTQVPLVAMVGVLVLFKFRLKALLRYSFGLIIPSILMLLYLQRIGVLHDFWFWTVQFNLSAFAKEGSLAPRLVDWIRLTFPIAVIAVAGIYLPAKYRSKLIISWLLFTIIGGIARFGLLHLQPAVPYFSIIFAMLFYEVQKLKNKNWIGILIVLIILWLGYFYSRQKNLWQTKYFDAQTQNLVQRIENETKPGDKIFLLGVQPHLYVLTKTFPPGKIFIFQFPWFFKIAGDRVLNSLKVDHPVLVVYDSAATTDGQYLRDYGAFLLNYIRAHYVLVAKDGTNEYYEHWH